MKKKPTSKGRKRFSAGKQLGPDKSLETNLNVAAVGEFALDPQSQEIFSLVALWRKWNTPPAHPAGKRYDRARAELQAKRTANADKALLALLRPALDRLDSKPFATFVKAIATVKYSSGPRTPAVFEFLRAVHQVAVQNGIAEPSLEAIETMTKAELKLALRQQMDNHTLRKKAKAFGRRFKPVKGGRPKKPGAIPA